MYMYPRWQKRLTGTANVGLSPQAQPGDYRDLGLSKARK